MSNRRRATEPDESLLGSVRILTMARDGVLVLIVALALRLLHVWQLHDTQLLSVLMGDARSYDAWARALAAGDWLGRDVFYQAPLYPYWLGALYALFGRDLVLVRVAQAVVGAVSCAALWFAGSRLVSRRAGLAAGLMLAVYPPAIFFDALIQKSVLDVLWVCVTLALIGWMADRPADRTHVAAVGLGLVMGALSLTRENALVLMAVVLAWLLWRSRASPRQRLLPVLSFAVGVAVLVVPVAARNHALGGGFSVTTFQFGSNLFIGNNPAADGSYVALRAGRGSPEYERLDATELAEQASGRSLTPPEVSAFWTRRTLEYIRAQPDDWLRLIALKARLLWSRVEIIDTESLESYADQSWPLRMLGQVWHFGVLVPLAIVGLWGLWPKRRVLWPLYAMGAAYAASVVMFFVVARYRYPLVPIAMVFAGAALVEARHWWATASRRRLVGVGVTVAIMTGVSFVPHHSGDARRAITENNLGAALQEDGRPGEAIDRYRRALALDATYTPALNNLGTALRAAGRVDEAIETFEQAIAQRPATPSVHFNLGNALLSVGRRADAIAQFRRALDLNPRLVDAHNNLGQALEAEGRLDQAIDAFRVALSINERLPRVHHNLGNALATKGVLGEAAAHLRRAIELDPSHAAGHYDYGSLMVELGATEPAMVALREAIRLRPDYAEAHNNLGIALATQGRLPEAISHWEAALRLNPGLTDARRNLERATAKP
ncbi:MAG: tetratricopeptide repeat protein [Acidobacteriota bacterium]